MGNLKKSNYFKRYSSQFYKYFFSYLLLLVLVLSILGVVVYKGFILTMENEVKKSNLSAITQIKNIMDIRLKEMERIALNISFNDNLKYYRVSRSDYEALEVVRELKKYKSSNEFVYDIALYYNRNKHDRIYTTMTSANLDIFFNYIYKYDGLDKDAFLEIVKGLDMPQIYEIRNVKLNNSIDTQLATYIYPVAVNTVYPYITVIFFIQEADIINMMRSGLDEYDGYIYILDAQRNLISFLETNAEGDLIAILDTLKRTSHKGSLSNMDIKGRNYSVAQISSNYNGWSYIMARRTDQLMGEVNRSRLLFNYGIISVLVLGMVIAFLFAIGHYKPLKNLVDMILNQGIKYSNLNDSDEFEYIIQTIQGVSNENHDLTEQLRDKSALIRNQLITKLVHGEFKNSEEFVSLQETYDLVFCYPYFAVLVFVVDHYSQFDAKNHKSVQDLAAFSIKNVAGELAEEIGQGYDVEIAHGRGVTLLLNMKEEYVKERYISELAFKTKDFFMKHFGFTLTVGIGNVYNKIELIHESFLEANRAIYYRLIKGYGNVIFYEDIKERKKQIYKYPSQLEEELIMAIKGGKSDVIEGLINSMKDHIINHFMTIEAVQCMCFGIINSIMKTLNDMNIDANQSFTNGGEMLFAQPFDTIDNLMKRIIVFCTALCKYVEEQKESKNFELREQILYMIEESYRDPLLSLEGIASKLNMSPSYISRYFKDQTGYSLMQYIDMLRMNDVKRLLIEEDTPLKDIINQVGYTDRSSFYRKFKKREGVTPSQYRNIVKTHEN